MDRGKGKERLVKMYVLDITNPVYLCLSSARRRDLDPTFRLWALFVRHWLQDFRSR